MVSGVLTDSGEYSAIWDPPSGNTQVDLPRLLVQWALVVVVTAAWVTFLLFPVPASASDAKASSVLKEGSSIRQGRSASSD